MVSLSFCFFSADVNVLDCVLSISVPQNIFKLINSSLINFVQPLLQSVGKSEGWEAFKQCLKQEMKAKF